MRTVDFGMTSIVVRNSVYWTVQTPLDGEATRLLSPVEARIGPDHRSFNPMGRSSSARRPSLRTTARVPLAADERSLDI